MTSRAHRVGRRVERVLPAFVESVCVDAFRVAVFVHGKPRSFGDD
jgi:hypothetical protein